jgi:hypothetical protein
MLRTGSILVFDKSELSAAATEEGSDLATRFPSEVNQISAKPMRGGTAPGQTVQVRNPRLLEYARQLRCPLVGPALKHYRSNGKFRRFLLNLNCSIRSQSRFTVDALLAHGLELR